MLDDLYLRQPCRDHGPDDCSRCDNGRDFRGDPATLTTSQQIAWRQARREAQIAEFRAREREKEREAV